MTLRTTRKGSKFMRLASFRFSAWRQCGYLGGQVPVSLAASGTDPMRQTRLLSLITGAALGAAALLVPATASAKVVVKETVKYYPVKGRDGLEVSKAMLVGGSRNINMHHAIAATSTRFSLSDAQVGVKNGRCVVNDVKVTLDIVYLYPKWSMKDAAGRKVRKAWDTFYAELLKHEQTHGKIAKAAAARIEKELKSLSGTVALGCKDFGKFADRRFNKIADELKKQQLAFDARENRDSSKITKLQIALLKSQ
jgi:predicted secreted Zn-dependent protease